jgi:hypothetical protein
MRTVNIMSQCYTPGTPNSRGDHVENADKSKSEEATVCPVCGESQALTKVKGCIRCLRCHFKFDCNGW